MPYEHEMMDRTEAERRRHLEYAQRALDACGMAARMGAPVSESAMQRVLRSLMIGSHASGKEG